MSLLNDFTGFIERNFDSPAEAAQRIDKRIESAKALLGETLEYAAPEGTKRRTVLDKLAQVSQAVGAGISTAALFQPEHTEGRQRQNIMSYMLSKSEKQQNTKNTYANATNLQRNRHVSNCQKREK